jgi:hypothetical protein
VHLANAKRYIDACLSFTRAPSYQWVGVLTWTFTYTVAAIIYDLAGEQPKQVKAWIAEVDKAFSLVDATNPPTDQTYWGGTPGLLYASTILNSYFGNGTIGRASIVKAATLLYKQGVNHSEANGSTPYLQWDVGEDNVGFLGQASGWGGPLYALLQARAAAPPGPTFSHRMPWPMHRPADPQPYA